MKAIILAAGRGSRMRRLTEHRPKCLIEVRGRTLLNWQLDSIRSSGIQDVGIVTGYKRELLQIYGLTEFHNPRWAETNMVISLTMADEWLAASPCIVSYSDIFFEPSAVQSLMATNAPLAITYDPNWLELWMKRFSDPLLDAETFRIDANNTLVEISNKPSCIAEVQGQYMGLLRFTPEAWAEIKRYLATMTLDSRDHIHLTGVLQAILDLLPVTAIPYVGQWGEVDHENDLVAYRVNQPNILMDRG